MPHHAVSPSGRKQATALVGRSGLTVLMAITLVFPAILVGQGPPGGATEPLKPTALNRALAGTVTIDFDSLADGEVVTTQFPEATFSSTGGNENKVTAQDLGSSLPNFICTGPPPGSINCRQDTYVDFTSPVSDLEFLAVGIEGVGQVADVNVFVGAVLSSTIPIVGAGTAGTPVLVDLTAFTNVTRIEIVNISDFAGIGWDDFSFTPAPTAPTLPAYGIAILALLLAIAAAAALRRRSA